MKNKTLIGLFSLEAIVCAILALTLSSPDGGGYLVLAQFPYAQIGQLLRVLSLSGAFGNVVAFVLYIGLCALPLLFIALHAKKHTVKAEDGLLLVISGFAFYMLYMMINPGPLSRIPSFINIEVGKAALGGACHSLLIGYFLIKLLRKADSSRTDALLKVLRLLLALTCVVIVFAVSYIGISDVKAKFAAIQSGNTDPAVSLGFTYVFVVLRFVLTQLPAVLEIGIFLLAIRLCGHLRADRYGEDAVSAAKRLASFSKNAVIAVLLTTLTLNLAQIIFAGSLVSVDFLTTLPVDSLIVAFAALLLARFFTASRELAQDNQLFI